MRNIFSKISCTKCGTETSPRFFSKKIKVRHIPRSTVCSFIQFVFVVCQTPALPNYIESEVLTTCFYLIKRFLKEV